MPAEKKKTGWELRADAHAGERTQRLGYLTDLVRSSPAEITGRARVRMAMTELSNEFEEEGRSVLKKHGIKMEDIIRYFVKFAGTSKMFEKYTCPIPNKGKEKTKKVKSKK